MVRIFIDPGHGGADIGAAANGLKEKDLTLAISKYIKKTLAEYPKAEVRLSRTSDKTVSLKARTDAANKWRADIFLSVHINAGGGTGFESYIYNRLTKSSITNKWRNMIHKEVMKENHLKERGEKYANFHVLRESAMSAVLTENGFIDSKSDAKHMKQTSWIQDVAQGHAAGIIKIFHLKKSSQGKQKKKIQIKNAIKGYYMARNAKERTEPRSVVPTGSYYIYKKAENMINVSKNQHVPGSWVNPADYK